MVKTITIEQGHEVLGGIHSRLDHEEVEARISIMAYPTSSTIQK